MNNLIPNGVRILDDGKEGKSTTILFGVGANQAEADRSDTYELSTDGCPEKYRDAIEDMAKAWMSHGHGLRRYRHYWGDAIKDGVPGVVAISPDDEGNTLTIAVGS